MEDQVMTSRVRFHFVDVFASSPLTGNPLPLVPDADDLSEAQRSTRPLLTRAAWGWC
jgi:hypothetical protein